MPSRVGYARVSTAGQNLDSQLDALKQAGCDKVFSDQISGAKVFRPGWDELLKYLRSGDTIVVTGVYIVVEHFLAVRDQVDLVAT